MNQQIITDHAEAADFYVGNNHWDKSHEEQQRLFLAKIAEYIVDDCIRLIQLITARDPQNSVQYKQSVGHVHKIKQYFGVE